ncbi:MAG: hypothetical protein AAGH65_10090 [Pseudomonadota bacterium]
MHVLKSLFVSLLLVSTVSANTDVPTVNDSTEVWSAWSANAQLKVFPDSLSLAGVEYFVDGQKRQDGSVVTFTDLNLGALEFHAPYGNFEQFLDGRMVLAADLRLSHDGNVVSVDRLLVERNPNDRHGLTLLDGNGVPLFTASHVHVYTLADKNQLIMERMDVKMTQQLADLLGVPEWGGLFVGELALDALLHIPAGARLVQRGTTCNDRPKWPTDGFDADVELIGMGTVADRGTVVEDGKTFEILTPSARLKNDTDLNAADVPWYTKFTGPFPPYDNDQHPYLIWNLYRISDGRLEQVGVSGMKYAFLTINVSCTINCGDGGIPQASGHILWPGCEDVYGVGNNDNPSDIGPRGEINPRTGVFESTGSFFDQSPPGGNGVQDNGSNGPGENRMKVWVEDLQTPDADYLFESWYVIRDDVDIFNGMGYHPMTPNNISGNSWQYGLGTFSQGRAVDEWVAPGGTPATGEMNVVFSDAEAGHLQLLVKAEEIAPERWRYTYVVKNYDVDHGIESFSINSPGNVSDWYFHDPDQDDTNEWLNNDTGTALVFSAPPANPLLWGQAFTFGFESEGAPVAATIDVELGSTYDGRPVVLNLLGPDRTEGVFSDSFEADF